jgi:hypothetical protein
MAMTIEQEVAVLGPAPDQEFHPHIEEIQDRSAGLCANERCKKGPNGTRGIVKSRSRRAKYCCASCRVSVCRRNRPKPPDTDKPKRKARKDKKYPSHAARQNAYEWRKWGRDRISRMR